MLPSSPVQLTANKTLKSVYSFPDVSAIYGNISDYEAWDVCQNICITAPKGDQYGYGIGFISSLKVILVKQKDQ